MIGGRFKAEKADTKSAAPIQKTVNMTKLFHTQLSHTPKKPTGEEKKEELPPKDEI